MRKRTISFQIPWTNNPWILSTVGLSVALVITIIFSAFIFFNRAGISHAISSSEASKKAIAYINDNILNEPNASQALSIKKVSGVYEISTQHQEKQIPVYMTLDGRFLFLGQSVDLLNPGGVATAADASSGGSCPGGSAPSEKDIPPVPANVDWSIFAQALSPNVNAALENVFFKTPQRGSNGVYSFVDYPSCGNNVMVFYYDWCGWSQRLNPVMAQAKKDYPNTTFTAINIDKNLDLAKLYGVDVSPVTVISCNSKINGWRSKETLYPLFDSYLKNK